MAVDRPDDKLHVYPQGFGPGDLVSLAHLRLNEKNPRRIAESAMETLMDSIKRDPQFMELRPIVIDEDRIIIGGNQRYVACTRLGYTAVPGSWVRVAAGLTPEQRARFVIVDNAPEGMSGYWDMETLQIEYDMPALQEMGFLFPEPVDPVAAWKGMPAFDQQDLSPVKTLPVHFATEEDVAAFAQLIGQTITVKTLSIWFPAAVDHRKTDTLYVDES
jgi:hypothetical protein